MGSWVTRSRPSLQLATATGCFVVGLALVIGFRGFTSVRADAFAGFLLGVMLAVVGILGLIFAGAQTVTVDPGARRIDVEEMSVVGRRSRSIRFDAVRSVEVGFLGKRSNFVRNYYLVLNLRDGKHYALFAPGRFWKGASDKATVEGWRQRLEAYLSVSHGPVAPTGAGFCDDYVSWLTPSNEGSLHPSLAQPDKVSLPAK
jgi:hypothetical protein